MLEKIRKQPVDWRDIYQHASKNIWEPQPHQFSELAVGLTPRGYATDLGSGEGYDALYFAEQGFATTATDVSEIALNGIKTRALRKNLDVDTKIADVKTTKLTRPQSLIASYGVLHFLAAEHGKQMRHFQEMTVSGGVHSIYTFGNRGDFYDIGSGKYWFPNIAELQVLYKNWRIHHLEEKTVEMFVRGDNNEVLYNNLIKILAQKQ